MTDLNKEKSKHQENRWFGFFNFWFFWLTVSKPDRREWHNVCFTQLIMYAVPTLCESTLLLHADYLRLPPRMTS